MKFLFTLSALIVLIALATAYPFGTYSSFTGDFGGPTAFGGSFGPQTSALTGDNRQNRGPVVFPMSPADAPVESSGVVIGASGFGFVPPGQQMKIYGKKYVRFKGHTEYFRYRGRIHAYRPTYFVEML